MKMHDTQADKAVLGLVDRGMTFGTCLCMVYLKNKPELQPAFYQALRSMQLFTDAAKSAAARLRDSQDKLRKAKSDVEVQNATIVHAATLLDLATANRELANVSAILCSMFGNAIGMALGDIAGKKLDAAGLMDRCLDLVGIYERGETPPKEFYSGIVDDVKKKEEKNEP